MCFHRTHKGTDGSYELRLHGLSLGEPTPNQDRVIRDLVRNFMCEAGERGGSSDQGARVEGSGHALMNGGQFELCSKDQMRGVKKTYARPSVLKRSNEPHDK